MAPMQENYSNIVKAVGLLHAADAEMLATPGLPEIIATMAEAAEEMIEVLE